MFSELPTRSIMLLEDIDATASLQRGGTNPRAIMLIAISLIKVNDLRNPTRQASRYRPYSTPSTASFHPKDVS